MCSEQATERAQSPSETAWQTPPRALQLPKVRQPCERAQSSSLATTQLPLAMVHRPAALQSADAAHCADEPATHFPGLPLHRPWRLHSAVCAQGPFGFAVNPGSALVGFGALDDWGAGFFGGGASTFGGGFGAGGGSGLGSAFVGGAGVTGCGGDAHPVATKIAASDEPPQKIAAGDRMGPFYAADRRRASDPASGLR